jgi:hypothetical protein
VSERSKARNASLDCIEKIIRIPSIEQKTMRKPLQMQIEFFRDTTLNLAKQQSQTGSDVSGSAPAPKVSALLTPDSFVCKAPALARYPVVSGTT